MQEKTEVLIRCPICGKTFSLGGVVQHRRKLHKDISLACFVEQIADAKRNRCLEFSKATIPSSGMDTATSILNDARESRLKGGVTVSGGGFGVKR